jgi:hypothetical protein
MNIDGLIRVTGRLAINKFNEHGELVEARDHKNLVVQTGKRLLATRLIADTRPAITTTGGSANGTTATITFASQTVIPYSVGDVVTISGVVPTVFNGRHRITSVSNDSITYDLTSGTVTITDNGIINSLFNGTIKTMRLGTISTTANISDTQLYSQIGSTNLYLKDFGEEDQEVFAAYVGLFPAGVATTPLGNVIQEAGLFNEDNIMLCRTVFPPVTKLAGESLEIFWKITIA